VDGDDEYPDMCIGRLGATRPEDVAAAEASAVVLAAAVEASPAVAPAEVGR